MVTTKLVRQRREEKKSPVSRRSVKNRVRDMKVAVSGRIQAGRVTPVMIKMKGYNVECVEGMMEGLRVCFRSSSLRKRAPVFFSTSMQEGHYPTTNHFLRFDIFPPLLGSQ